MASGLMPAWLSRFWSPPSECTHHVARDQPPVLESSGSSGGAHPVILCSGGLLRGFAHVRRHFFDAQSTARDAAQGAMDFILELYKVERAALDADLLGTPEHLELRQTTTSPTCSSACSITRRRASTD